MQDNKFLGVEEPVSLADINAVEQELGIVLPEDYMSHILKNNGGRPERRVFLEVKTDGQTIPRKISDLYSFRYGKPNFERSIELLGDQLHPDLILFADETGGDIFALSVGPADYGSIYYIAHESYRPPAFLEDEKLAATALDYGEGVYWLAPSFTAFLEGLADLPDVQ